MALKPLNSVGGFSVGETPANVILANGDISTTKINSGTSALTVTANTNATTFQANGQINIPGALVAVGNITAPYFFGNVQGNIIGNIVAGGSNTEIQFNDAGNSNGSANLTFNKTTNLFTVSGNANVSNLNSSGKVTASTLESNVAIGTAPLVVVSTTKVANLNVDLLDGFDTSQTATANTVVVRNADGNVAANFFIGNGSQLTGIGDAASIANGTSNVRIPAVNGNVNVSVAGNANILVVTGTGVNVAGTLNATGNANVGNIGAATANFTTANITGNANVGNLGSGGIITATGNVSGGNLTTSGALSVTGNANVGNIGGTGAVFTTLGGSLTTAAQPNITSVGTLSSLSVTGNVTAGNFVGTFANGNSSISIPAANGNINLSAAGGATELVLTDTGANITGTLNVSGNANVGNLGTAGLIVATGNVTGGNLNTGGVLSVTGNANVGNLGTAGLITATGNVTGGNLNTSGVLTVTGTGVSSIAGNLDMTSNNIINLATPVNPNDAATKQYVDDVAQGLNVHDAVAAATPNTLAIVTSGTITYNNGSSGVGANLTTTGSFNLIDGVNVQTAGTRILVKNEANAAHNGIYTWSNSTVITRATDYNTVPEVEAGDFVFVTGGTLYNDTGWVQTSTVTTIGTDNIDFTQFSGAGTYTAGTGLTLVGTEFRIANTTVTAGNYGNGDAVATFTVNAQGQLTAAGNTSITANAANLTGTTLNSSIVTSSLTSVGTLGSLSVTGNTTSGNFVGIFANGTSNVRIPAASGNVNISAAGTANVVVVTSTGVNVAGTLNATGNANVGNIGATNANISAITVTGNANVGNIGSGGIVSATGNVSGGNLTTGGRVDATGNITGGNLITGGTLSVTGNANVGNLGFGTGVITGSGNITAGNFIGVFANGNSNVSIPAANGNVNISSAGNANIVVVTGTGANINGYANITGNLTAGNINGGNIVVANFLQGTLTTAAQPNITSVGSLTSLTVTGNASAGNLSTGGSLSVTGNANVGNLGTATAIITTGNITTINSGLLQNGNSNITITANANISMFVTGNATARFVATSTGVNVAGTLNATGNANVGNIGATNANLTALTATGNANVGNIGATNANVTAITATGNANVGNLGTGGLIVATGNITGGNLVTGGQANVTGNVIAGNVYANTGIVGANIANIANRIDIGNTDIGWATLTTTAVTANQTIATFAVSGITGVEYLVKGVDATGTKYSVATVQAVTDAGTNVDYVVFGTATIGGTTGTLAVNIVSGNIALQVTPASTNSTVWTTQFRYL